jgi:ammonium transporter Rh
LVTTNTFLSLAGSTITAIGISALYKEGLSVLAITRATIAGGVAIGVCSIMIYIPGIALAVGVVAGAASFFSLRHLQGRF